MFPFLSLLSVNQTERGAGRDSLQTFAFQGFVLLARVPIHFADLTREKGLLMRSFEMWICLRVTSWVSTPSPRRRVTSGRKLCRCLWQEFVYPRVTMLMTRVRVSQGDDAYDKSSCIPGCGRTSPTPPPPVPVYEDPRAALQGRARRRCSGTRWCLQSPGGVVTLCGRSLVWYTAVRTKATSLAR